MRKFVSKNVVLIALLAVAATALAVTSATVARRSGAAPPAAAAKDPRSLREKARLGRGKFVGNVEFNKGAMKADLAQLIAHSAAVVIATVEENQCALSGDERVIRTYYKVRVEEVLKGGGVKAGSALTLSVPGGKVGFEDGSTAETQALWFRKLVNHRRYVLFLDQKGRADEFVTTGGPQGVYELPADGQGVVSHSGLREDPLRRFDKKDVQEFLTEVRSAVKKGKKA
jgi:hypothetical protein